MLVAATDDSAYQRFGVIDRDPDMKPLHRSAASDEFAGTKASAASIKKFILCLET